MPIRKVRLDTQLGERIQAVLQTITFPGRFVCQRTHELVTKKPPGAYAQIFSVVQKVTLRTTKKSRPSPLDVESIGFGMCPHECLLGPVKCPFPFRCATIANWMLKRTPHHTAWFGRSTRFLTRKRNNGTCVSVALAALAAGHHEFERVTALHPFLQILWQDEVLQPTASLFVGPALAKPTDHACAPFFFAWLHHGRCGCLACQGRRRVAFSCSQGTKLNTCS